MRDLQPSRTRRSSSRRDRHPAVLAWLILVLVALAPLPLGSTPPLSWTIWGLALGLMAILTIASRTMAGRQPAALEAPFVVGQVGFVILCLYLALQILPIGSLVGPFALTLSDGSTIEMDTISVSPGDTILMLLRMLSFGLLLALTALAARSHRGRDLLLSGIVIIVTLHALHGLLALFQFGDTLYGMEKAKYPGVATASFLNRNVYATFLAIGTAVALTCAARSMIQPRGDGLRLHYDARALLHLVAAAIMVTTVVTTQSRAGLAVTVVGAVTVLIAAVSTNVRMLRPLLLLTPVLLVLFGVMFLRLGEDVWLRYESVSDAFNFRLELYRQVLELISHRPWLGFGGGTFELAFTTVHDQALATELTWNEAHNTYLELWADLGLIFGSIPVLMAAGLFILILVRLSRGQGSWSGQTATLAAIAIVAIHSLFDFSLEIEAVTFLFVTVCGIGLAATSARQNKE